MSKNELGELPFPPLVVLDTDDPIEPDVLAKLLWQRVAGISLCVRSTEGDPKRGGYFFHIQPLDQALEQCEIFNFEKLPVASLPLVKLTVFINHCAGLAFDEEAFQFCQTVVNFRLDPEPLSERGS